VSLPRHREAGAGMRAIVFVHGVGTDADSWAPQLAEFGQHYRAIAWNLPGYGSSPALDEPSFANFAEALCDLLDELGIRRVDLVGHSYGGMVAQEFAARYPARLRTLTLSGTSPAFGRPDGEWQQAFVRQRLAPLEQGKTMAELAPKMIASLVGPAADEQGIAIARRSMAQVPSAAFATGIKLIVTFDRRDALAKIAAPTLVIAGERDTNAPAAMMEKMAAKIPDAEYVCLQDVGHLANLENPAAFNETLRLFLARH
jgi:3-oxoadipate enol-lactonase